MKHLLLYIFVVACVFTSASAFASPGDTTYVTTCPVVNADNSASYDSLLVLPLNKTYRKIFLVYTVNSHSCAPGSQYCHQWDYIGSVTLKPPHGDTIELARIITPFATSGWSRFPQPPNWAEDYVFDVTDFAPYLQDSITINSQLGVGSPGYGITTKFMFIEGTPDRNTVGITKIYSHGGTYGSAANPIDNNFPVMSETAPAGTVSADFRFIVSGHGSDANQCCEFAEHYYQLHLNGNSILQQNIWRDCGTSELYPQGGTWLYNRANWCPGASVLPYYDGLPGVTAGSNYTVNLSFEPYTVASPSGQYVASAAVLYYGGMNKTLDASMEDIIAPSSSPQHFRENPSDIPVVHIHNSGSTAISSVNFQYGVVDSPMQQYTWNGALAALADTVISLPASSSLTSMSAASQTGTYSFVVNITAVNGQTDQDQTNDTMRSRFIAAPNWPDTLIVKMLTSNLAADGQSLNANPADANWYITNVNGDTVLSRSNTTYSTLYNDTVALPAVGFYKLTISTPANCTGLHWWAYDQGVTGYAPGYLQVKKITGTNLPMHGYTYATNTTPNGLKNEGEHDDFGCEYSQYFYVKQVSNTWVNNIVSTAGIDVYPNPANTELNIDFTGVANTRLSVSLTNILGQVVYAANVDAKSIKVNTSSLMAGIYTLICTTGDGGKNIQKVEIVH